MPKPSTTNKKGRIKMSKINRRSESSTNDGRIKALVEDMLINGTQGDTSKWRKAFKYLVRNRKMMKKIMEIDQNRAFEQYYMMGEDRTLIELSRRFGWEPNKLSRWRREFQWELKISERDELVGEILKVKAAKNVVIAKLEYSSIVNRVIREFVKNMDDYNKKVAEVNKRARKPEDMLPFKSLIYKAEDLERLVKLQLLLMGDVTERTESITIDKEQMIESQIAQDQETRELLKNLYQRTRSFTSQTKKIAIMDGGNGSGGREIDITEAIPEDEKEENQKVL